MPDRAGGRISVLSDPNREDVRIVRCNLGPNGKDQVMSGNINESLPERHQENHEDEPSPVNSRDQLFPASHEEWAEVLADATRYY